MNEHKMMGGFQQRIQGLNTSKLFAGFMMIFMNIGSRFVTIKLSKSQEAYIRNNIARELLIFSICWMGTKDLITSILLTAAFYILAEYILHEESKFCILPEKYKKYHMMFDMDGDGKVTKDEIKQAMDILDRAKKQNVYKHHS
jgi:hypothetical protein